MQYISYFSDDVVKVEFTSWSESAKSVHATTKSNYSAQSIAVEWDRYSFWCGSGKNPDHGHDDAETG